MIKVSFSRCWYIWLYIALIISIYSILSFMHPPSIGSDSAWGFLVWNSMENGAHFNQLLVPDPNDISKDVAKFLAWWSPGQYLIPVIFVKIGITLGQVLTIITLICSIVGLIGYYFLYQAFGLSKFNSVLSCAIISSTKIFALSFGTFLGGDILAFSSTPWVILLCLRYKEMKVVYIPIIIIVFLIGAFLKLSFVIVGLAILVSLFLFTVSIKSGIKRNKIVWYGAKMLLTFLVFYLVLYITYTSKGVTPVSHSFNFSSPATSFLTAMVGPLYGALSIGDFIKRLLIHPPNPIIQYAYQYNIISLAFAIPTVLLVYLALKHSQNKLYNSFLLGFMMTYVLIFFFFFASEAYVSNADRHFRVAGLLLIPGIIGVLKNYSTSFFKILGFTAILVFCIYGVTSFFVRYEANKKFNNVSSNGFTHRIISKEALSTLHVLDEKLPRVNNLFYVTSPEIALEVEGNRVMSSLSVIESILDLSNKIYRGRVDNLIVVIEQRFVNSGYADVILRSFSDYEYADWRRKELNKFVVYYQGENTELIDNLIIDENG